MNLYMMRWMKIAKLARFEVPAKLYSYLRTGGGLFSSDSIRTTSRSVRLHENKSALSVRGSQFRDIGVFLGEREKFVME